MTTNLNLKRPGWPKHLLLLPLLVGVLLLGCSGATPPSTAAPGATAAAPSATTPAAAPKKLTVAEVANLPLNPARQKILEDGARAEGEFMLYSTSSGFEPVAAAFMKKYPFIKAEVFQSGVAPLIQRTRAEVAANRLGGDMISGGLRTFVPMSDLMIPFKSPDADFSILPNGSVNHISLLVIAYNTRFVTAAEAPKTVEDLFQPKWKGKLGFHGPPNSFAAMWTGLLIKVFGEEQATVYLKKLGDQNPFLYQSGGVGVQSLISGETYLGTNTQSAATEARQTGAPVSWVPIDPTASTVTLAGVFEKTSHPYSAMLFMDFLLGPEGQKLAREEGNYLAMSDIKNGEAFGVKLPKRVILESPGDDANLAKWTDMFTALVAKKK